MMFSTVMKDFVLKFKGRDEQVASLGVSDLNITVAVVHVPLYRKALRVQRPSPIGRKVEKYVPVVSPQLGALDVQRCTPCSCIVINTYIKKYKLCSTYKLFFYLPYCIHITSSELIVTLQFCLLNQCFKLI